MNKFCKKLSIIFVMAFAIMLGYFNNVFAADSTNYVPKKDYSANLIANYKLNEASGTTCVDSVHNDFTYNGTYNGTKINADGNKREFNGTSDYISFSDPIIKPGKKSIKFKVKCASIAGAEFILGNRAINNGGLQIGIQDGYILIIHSNGKTTSGTYKSQKKIDDGEWHTVLFTWDGTLNVNSAKLYIDNLTNNNESYTMEDVDTLSEDNFQIGMKSLINPFYFKGQLDDIEIYNDVVEYGINPTDNTGNAILTITMTNGNVKSYTVSMSKVNDFISWYDNRVSVSTGKAYYTFDKTDNLQPFSKKTEYIIFDKISSYEVDEYTK